MFDYEVIVDKENKRFIVKGPFESGALPVLIPDDDPWKKDYIDLFLHKADIERGIEFLQCISKDKEIVVNEALFIAGLNNCMKCFKYSSSRKKLEKAEVFKDYEQIGLDFVEFEKMRDKHFDHDENGMLQAIAFLLLSEREDVIFAGPPSVVWNRAKLNYCLAGKKLQEIMRFIRQYLIVQIDNVGGAIVKRYKNSSKEKLLEGTVATIELATYNAVRKK